MLGSPKLAALARPPMLAEQNRRSSSTSRGFTSGRGGAGNIKTETAPPPPTCPTTLETPTIKAPTYTTGRGGSGNMAANSSAAETRKAQDIQPHPRRESFNSSHVGRGGGGNVFKPSKEEMNRAKAEERARSKARNGDNAIEDSEDERSASPKGLKEKVLGVFGKK